MNIIEYTTQENMMIPYAGELAALGTAITWSISALIFTSAGHKMGSFTMSHYRMLFGLVFISALNFIANKSFYPVGIAATNWWLLGVSGFFGFFLCDSFLYQSYMDIGPRIGSLLFNVYPIFSAILGWLILGEILSVTACLGIVITIMGIIWVVLEKSSNRLHYHKEKLYKGIGLALGAALFETISFLVAKPAMAKMGGVDAMSATLIRAIVGGSAYWIVSVFRGKIGVVIKRGLENLDMLWIILLGAAIGPAIGVWLSMVAIKFAPIGIASTLMALMPVTILPMTAIYHKERISYRAVFGAIVACLGAALLFNSR